MAEKDMKGMELKGFTVRKAENGFKVCADYEKKNKTLSQKAGWVPICMYESKEFVYKTDEETAAEVKKLLKEMK